MKISLPLARPPWKKTGKYLESLCRKALYEFSLVEETSIAVALSGGKDSLTLLFLLHAISGKGFPPFKLTAIHVDGEFSCGAGVDKAFLQAICNELKIPLIVKTSQIRKEKLECYSCSRERRKLIFKAAKELGIHTIAFGHHREDSLQTALLNLFHKGEFAGILPKIEMFHYGISIIRPLIFISEENIRQFAKEYGFSRISCNCPVGQNSYRKKAEDLLKKIEMIFPSTRTNLFQCIQNFGSKKAAIKENILKKKIRKEKCY